MGDLGVYSTHIDTFWVPFFNAFSEVGFWVPFSRIHTDFSVPRSTPNSPQINTKSIAKNTQKCNSRVPKYTKYLKNQDSFTVEWVFFTDKE